MGIGGTSMSTNPGGSGSASWPIKAESFGEDGEVKGKFKISSTLESLDAMGYTGSSNPTTEEPFVDGTLITTTVAADVSATATIKGEGVDVEDDPDIHTCAVEKVETAGTAANPDVLYTVKGTTTTKIDPSTATLEGIQDNFIDFGQKGLVKNTSGFSWNLGVLMQKTLNCYTMGFRCAFGTNGSSSQLKYKTGGLGLKVVENQNFVGSLGISDERSTEFRLKNKWFAEFIFEFGYVVAQRLQLFVGPGVILQNQKLSYIGESGQSSSSLSKTVTGSVLACGARYALNQNATLGLEYQRQWLGKKSWDNVASIVPKDIYCCGVPVSKTNTNLFLVTLTYMFSGK